MSRDRQQRDGGRIVSIQTTSERGGAEYANVDLLDALAGRGHDVVLLTDLPELVAGTQVPVRPLALGPKLASRSAARVALQAPRTLLRLARALHGERPVAATLLHFKKEQLLCSLLPRRLTGRIVWFEWGPVPLAMRRRLPMKIYSLASRRAHRVLAVSEGTARTVIEAGVPRRKVIVDPTLVSMHAVVFDGEGRRRIRDSWGVGAGTLVVGCISRFQRRKRNDVVIDAMASLEGDVLLVLSGEGDEERALRERAEPYGERVRFVPNVRGHVEEFLSACDLLVFAPSPTEADRPRVIVMAQLVGVPVISTHPMGADALKPPGAGTIVEPHHDPRALAEAIARYRDDPARRARESEAARRAMLARHDINATLDEIENVTDTHSH